MIKIEHTYPSLEDFQNIFTKYDFAKFNIINEKVIDTNIDYDLAAKMRIGIDFKTYIMNLRNRLSDAQKCFGFLHFYFDKGIPDDEYFISPGIDGQSISYFHNFNEQNFSNKINYDFYSDFFYYKLFSAWDIVGHIINIIFQLEIKENNVSFGKCYCDKLKSINVELYNGLGNILQDNDFKKANRIRNDISHNLSPNNIGAMISDGKKIENTIVYQIGIGKYTKSKEFLDNVYKSLDLMYQTLELIYEK